MSAHPKQPHKVTEEAEEHARKKDPHGVGPVNEAADHEASALPTDDRHQTERSAGKE